MRSGQATKPHIPGYIVWDGRQLWHARYNGSCAEANRKRLPWHVVAVSPQQLVEELNRSQATGGGDEGRAAGAAGNRSVGSARAHPGLLRQEPEVYHQARIGRAGRLHQEEAE